MTRPNAPLNAMLLCIHECVMLVLLSYCTSVACTCETVYLFKEELQILRFNSWLDT